MVAVRFIETHQGHDSGFGVWTKRTAVTSAGSEGTCESQELR